MSRKMLRKMSIRNSDRNNGDHVVLQGEPVIEDVAGAKGEAVGCEASGKRAGAIDGNVVVCVPNSDRNNADLAILEGEPVIEDVACEAQRERDGVLESSDYQPIFDCSLLMEGLVKNKPLHSKKLRLENRIVYFKIKYPKLRKKPFIKLD